MADDTCDEVLIPACARCQELARDTESATRALPSAHPMRHVHVSGVLDACIDVGIADVCEQLARRGVAAEMSCQGTPGHEHPFWRRPTLAFGGWPPAAEFLTVCLRTARVVKDRPLYERITGAFTAVNPLTAVPDGRWAAGYAVRDLALDDALRSRAAAGGTPGDIEPVPLPDRWDPDVADMPQLTLRMLVSAPSADLAQLLAAWRVGVA